MSPISRPSLASSPTMPSPVSWPLITDVSTLNSPSPRRHSRNRTPRLRRAGPTITLAPAPLSPAFPCHHVLGLCPSAPPSTAPCSGFCFSVSQVDPPPPPQDFCSPRVSRPRPHATGCEGGDGKRRGGASAAREGGGGAAEVPETKREHRLQAAPQVALEVALEVALQSARSGSQLRSRLKSRFGSRISCSTAVGAIDCGRAIWSRLAKTRWLPWAGADRGPPHDDCASEPRDFPVSGQAVVSLALHGLV